MLFLLLCSYQPAQNTHYTLLNYSAVIMLPERLFWLQDIDLVPSHVVPSLTVDKEHNDVYSAYNKPGAVMYWLRVCPLLTCIWHPRLASQTKLSCTDRLQPHLAHKHACCWLFLLILTGISLSGSPAEQVRLLSTTPITYQQSTCQASHASSHGFVSVLEVLHTSRATESSRLQCHKCLTCCRSHAVAAHT